MRFSQGSRVFSTVLFLLSTVRSSNWQENLRPKLFAKLNARDYQSFSGTLQATANKNATPNIAADYFSVMLYTHMTDEALVVGARNILYKLSVDELRLRQTLTWNSIDLDRESCLVKGTLSPNYQKNLFWV